MPMAWLGFRRYDGKIGPQPTAGVACYAVEVRANEVFMDVDSGALS